MAVVCPTVTPLSVFDYNKQMEKVAGLSERIQIDLMDADFAKSKSVVNLDDVWWPVDTEADIHLMFKDPFEHLETLIHLRPSLVIIHVETMVHHMHFAAELHKEGIKAGLALLPETPVANVEQILHSFDHMLIFSGKLGYFGGKADLALASKAKEAKDHHPDLEVGWDGGINPEVAPALVDAGIDVLNVGGYIHLAENARVSYDKMIEAVQA